MSILTFEEFTKKLELYEETFMELKQHTGNILIQKLLVREVQCLRKELTESYRALINKEGD